MLTYGRDAGKTYVGYSSSAGAYSSERTVFATIRTDVHPYVWIERDAIKAKQSDFGWNAASLHHWWELTPGQVEELDALKSQANGN